MIDLEMWRISTVAKIALDRFDGQYLLSDPARSFGWVETMVFDCYPASVAEIVAGLTVLAYSLGGWFTSDLYIKLITHLGKVDLIGQGRLAHIKVA